MLRPDPGLLRLEMAFYWITVATRLFRFAARVKGSDHESGGIEGTSRMNTTRVMRVALGVFCVAICFVPFLSRLRWPSIYADDVVRLSQLQTETLGGMLFQPFNEHVAPLFQLVSWLTWQLAGRSLANLPLAFTLASFVPFLLTLGMLHKVMRRETGSDATAFACVALFALSWLAVETVYWYSASSFMWSLFLTLVAWSGSSGTGARHRATALLSAACAPAFSMIGILAGPAAAVRALIGDGSRRPLESLAPLAGTVLFLAAYTMGQGGRVASASGPTSATAFVGLIEASRAPAASLLPAVFAIKTIPTSGWTGPALSAATAVVAVGLLVRVIKERDERALIGGGLFLISGGYVLTFCARAGDPAVTLLETQRYHLFPMLGLVFLAGSWLRRAFAFESRRPELALLVSTAFTVLLLVIHQGEMNRRARFLRFPDQHATLAALDRLASSCARSGITRDQARVALDPVETAWTPVGYNIFNMLSGCARTSRVPDQVVKSAILATLSPSDRRSLCGGMDATPYLIARKAVETGRSGRLTSRFRLRTTETGQLVSDGWPSFLEYEMDGDGASTSTLNLTVDSDTGGLLELWWRGEAERWSETRSIRLHPRSGGDWNLALEKIPHWDPAGARRLRILFHDAGPVSSVAPRLIR